MRILLRPLVREVAQLEIDARDERILTLSEQMYVADTTANHGACKLTKECYHVAGELQTRLGDAARQRA